MAAALEFTAALTRLGFNPPTVLFFGAQGIHTVEDLCSFPPSEMKELIKHSGHWRPTAPAAPIAGPAPGRGGAGRGAAAAAAAAAALQATTVVFPFLSVRKLKALRAWADYRRARQDDDSPDLFQAVELDIWLFRLTELDELKEAHKDDTTSSCPKLGSFNSWVVWEEAFLTHIDELRSPVTKVPLSYLTRSHKDVTQ